MLPPATTTSNLDAKREEPFAKAYSQL
jgi:hypothetical protein